MSSRTGRSRNAERAPPRGFTLIELILVMTILTAVIGLAAPSLARFFRGRSLDSEARRLLALTRHGQSRAVSEGIPMELWLDAERRTFGLEAEASYAETDPAALDFTLEADLELEVVKLDPGFSANRTNLAALNGARSSLLLGTGVSRPLVLSRHPELPAIRFLPDGTLGDASPQMVRVTDRDGGTLWLALARDLVHYEIRTSQTNANRR